MPIGFEEKLIGIAGTLKSSIVSFLVGFIALIVLVGIAWYLKTQVIDYSIRIYIWEFLHGQLHQKPRITKAKRVKVKGSDTIKFKYPKGYEAPFPAMSEYLFKEGKKYAIHFVRTDIDKLIPVKLDIERNGDEIKPVFKTTLDDKALRFWIGTDTMRRMQKTDPRSFIERHQQLIASGFLLIAIIVVALFGFDAINNVMQKVTAMASSCKATVISNASQVIKPG